MGYYVKYHELQNTYNHICNQMNAWNSELENVKQKMLEVALMQEIKGETANSIRSYILEIHIPLINFLQQVLAEYKTRMREYVNDYNQIDNNENAKIAIDRLDEQITNIHAGMEAFQAIEESVAQAIGMVAGLVSVSVPSGERITNNYERLGNKASKLKDEVGECEYSHLTSDFSNIEDKISNILQIINGQSQKSNVTITAYQAGSISKVAAFQKLQEAAATENIDFNGSTKESEDIITGLGTKSIIDVMRDEFTNLVKENKDKLNNIKKKILDNLNQHISKYQYVDFNTPDGFISGGDILVDVLDFLLQSRKTFFQEYPELNINPITGMTVDESKELYNSIKEILFKGYDNVVKLGANSNIPIISDYSRGLEGDTELDWNIYKLRGSFVKGGRQAAYDMVDGIIKTLIDPAETAEGIVNLLSLSKEDWLQIKDKAVEYFNKTVVNGTAEERAEFSGYAVFEVAMMIMTLSEIKSAKTAAGLADDVVKGGVDDVVTKTKPYTNSRPSYGKGQVEEVWNNAKDPVTGKVYDPTGVEIKWDTTKQRNGQWDMGHIPGEKYSDIHKLYMDGTISKKEFLEWYKNPSNYRPELPSTNRGHLFEK